MTTIEIWKEYQGIYISNMGRVIRDYKKGGGFNPYICDIKPRKDGYMLITINKKKKYLHILIGKLFIPNPENKPTIDHIKLGIKNKSDNRVSNLRWATMSEQNYNRKPMKIVKCPHCDKQGVLNGMKRWHFNNCKNKFILSNIQNVR